MQWTQDTPGLGYQFPFDKWQGHRYAAVWKVHWYKSNRGSWFRQNVPAIQNWQPDLVSELSKIDITTGPNQNSQSDYGGVAESSIVYEASKYTAVAIAGSSSLVSFS